MPGRVRPARSSCGSAPAAPWVCTTCAVVCAEAQGCFPAREKGAAAKEAPQPAPFATTAFIAPFLAPPLAPHRVRLYVENNRPHKTEHVPMEGEKTKQTNNKTKALPQCQAGVAALSGLRRSEPARSLPGRERRARAGASAEHPARLTAAPRDRLLAKSEGTLTLFLAEHH